MKFKVGDKVRMRTWDELSKTYHIDQDNCMWGPASTDFCITSNMRKYCGKTLEVDRVEPDFYQMENSNYFFEEWMLEPNTYSQDGVSAKPSLFFARPTQVRFYESIRHEDMEESPNYGIAYKDEIICACCGGIFEMNKVYDIEKLPWTNFEEAIGE